MRLMKLSVAILALGMASAFPRAQATEAPPRKERVEPQILSMGPISVSRGTQATLEVRGKGLADAHTILFDCPLLKGEVKSIENQSGEQKLALDLSISEETVNGVHTFRIVSPMGITNPRSLLVHDEVAVSEESLPLEVQQAARRLPPAPLVVLGKTATAGEVDYYAFEGEAGEGFFFEVYNDRRFDAQLLIYERAESWFDSQALNRLAFNDEPNKGYGDTAPRLSHRFEKKGRFLAAVTAFLGGGGSDHSYALRIVRGVQKNVLFAKTYSAHPEAEDWEERKFIRDLGDDRLGALRARSIPEKAEAEAPKLTVVSADETSEPPSGFREISIPSRIEGAIDHPADVDRFRFTIKDGSRLAVEIETPDRPAPLCTPRIAILDDTGQEVLQNIFAWVEGSGEFIGKAIESKVIAQFVRGGDYTLEIKDITTRNGGPDYRYEVILREQIPHIGKVHLAASFGRGGNGMVTRGAAIDHLNLVPGETRKISLMSEMEEGFNGQVLFTFENLPPGVEVFPVAELEPEYPRILDEGKKERFRPNYGAVTLLLTVSSNAPPTRLPSMVGVLAKPIQNGVHGPRLPVQTLPLTVVRLDEPDPARTAQSNVGETLANAPDAK